MRKIVVIAVREYLAALRTKSFLLSMVALPLLIGGSVFIQVLLQKVEATQVKRFAVVDRTPGQPLLAAIVQKAQTRNAMEIIDPQTRKQTQPTFEIIALDPCADQAEAITQQRYDLSEEVQEGMIAGFLDIGPDVYQQHAEPGMVGASAAGLSAGGLPPALMGVAGTKLAPAAERAMLRYQSKNPALDLFPRWVQKVVDEAVQQERGRAAGMRRETIEAITQPVPLVTEGLSRRNAQTGAIEAASQGGQIASLLAPAGLMALMFFMILFGATPLMQGVLEEKMQRIAEVLLGSVRPFALMLGKLLGMVAVSLTILAVYLSAAYLTARHYGVAEYVPLPVLAWFVVYQALAVLMYGSLFIAIGAACTDMKETQLLVLPVALLASLPMLTLRFVLQEPNSRLVTLFSFFPPATPMLMIARQAVPPGIAWWQPALGILGMLLTTALCVYAAGRIFRVGILMQGKGARIGELVRWVMRG